MRDFSMVRAVARTSLLLGSAVCLSGASECSTGIDSSGFEDTDCGDGTCDACGGETPNTCSDDCTLSDLPAIESLFPADYAVGSLTHGGIYPTVEIARSENEIEALINGHAMPYLEVGFSAFAQGSYVDASHEVQMWIWQMHTGDGAQAIYESLVDDPYHSVTWDALSIGAEARVADNDVQWWIHARKGIYFVELWVEPNDAGGKNSAIEFVGTVLDQVSTCP